MKPTYFLQPSQTHVVPEPRSEGGSSDHLLGLALKEWQDAIDAGLPLHRDELLEKYAEVRADLSGCLDGLSLIREMAAQVDGEPPAANDKSEIRNPKSEIPTLGDFRILRELGRGGMGIVYEAEQLSIGRRVALKVLPFAAMVDSRALVRFRNEIRAIGTLDHPNIVGVYFVGEERGVNYYAMQLVRGASLAELIAALRREVGGPGSEVRNQEPGIRSQEPDDECGKGGNGEFDRPLTTHLTPLTNFPI